MQMSFLSDQGNSILFNLKLKSISPITLHESQYVCHTVWFSSSSVRHRWPTFWWFYFNMIYIFSHYTYDRVSFVEQLIIYFKSIWGIASCIVGPSLRSRVIPRFRTSPVPIWPTCFIAKLWKKCVRINFLLMKTVLSHLYQNDHIHCNMVRCNVQMN